MISATLMTASRDWRSSSWPAGAIMESPQMKLAVQRVALAYCGTTVIFVRTDLMKSIFSDQHDCIHSMRLMACKVSLLAIVIWIKLSRHRLRSKSPS